MATYNDTASDSMAATDIGSSLRTAVGVKTESLIFSETWTDSYKPSAVIKEIITICCSQSSAQYVSYISIVDSVQFQDAVYIVWNDVISETLIVSDTASYDLNFYNKIVDKLIASSIVSTSIEANRVIQDALTLLDIAGTGFGAIIQDALGVTDSVIDQIKFIVSIVEDLIATETNSSTVKIFSIVQDSVQLTETTSLTHTLQTFIRELISFGGYLDYDDYQYTFVLNTENEAISTYTNYDFNSIYGNLAANDIGIYELSGNTDNGATIESVIRTGLMDFGESRHKQIPYAYLGLTNDGDVMLKSITDNYGIRNERWYKLVPSRDATDTTRVKLGKGVKARYWQFELMNINGADFDIESIELYPLVLKRRI